MNIEKITKYREYIKLVIYFLVLLIITPSLINIMGKAWSIDNSLIRVLASYLWVIDHSSIQIVINMIIGFLVGSLVLMLIDTKKRVQSLLLTTSLLYLTLNIFMGNILSNVNWGKYITWLFIGMLIGFLSGDGKKLLMNDTEFPKAAKNIRTLSWVIITVCLLSYYISLYSVAGDNASNLTGSILKDSFSTILFFVFLKEFIDYDTKDAKVFLLGPKESGKSLCMAGIYLKAMGTSKKPSMPNEGIQNLLKELDTSGWPDSTKSTTEYSFIHHYGTLFPKSTELRTIDYMGSYFEGISVLLDDMYSQKSSAKLHPIQDSNSNSKGENGSDLLSNAETREAVKLVAQHVYESSHLLLVLDGAKFPRSDDMQISGFISILNFFNKNKIHKNFYVVVTKCDIFCDEFEATTKESLDNETYIEFKDFMYNKLTQNLSIRQLLLEAQVNEIYPVFYHTTKDKSGNAIPVKDEFNNMYTFGFDHLLDAITL